jgi:hypothetical protein
MRRASLQYGAWKVKIKHKRDPESGQLSVIYYRKYLICALRWLDLAYIFPQVGKWQGNILSSFLMWVFGGEFFLIKNHLIKIIIKGNVFINNYLGIPVPWARYSGSSMLDFDFRFEPLAFPDEGRPYFCRGPKSICRMGLLGLGVVNAVVEDTNVVMGLDTTMGGIW